MDVKETDEATASIIPGTMEEEKSFSRSGKRGRPRKTPAGRSAKKTSKSISLILSTIWGSIHKNIGNVIEWQKYGL